MQKPKKKKIEIYDWDECTKYIEHKLGYPIRNTLSTYDEYRNFWHLICDCCTFSNPGEINLECLGEPENLKPWQAEILQCYLDEFGPGPYYIWW